MLFYNPTLFLFSKNLQGGLFAANCHRSQLKLQAPSRHLAAKIIPSISVAILEGYPGELRASWLCPGVRMNPDDFLDTVLCLFFLTTPETALPHLYNLPDSV